MEAVIATGGKQYRVAPGQVIKVERLDTPAGSPVEFTQVLLVSNDGQVTVEPTALASAKVTGEVVAEKKGHKVDRKKIRLDQPIRETGTFMVEVEVGGGVTASVKTIVAEAKE